MKFKKLFFTKLLLCALFAGGQIVGSDFGPNFPEPTEMVDDEEEVQYIKFPGKLEIPLTIDGVSQICTIEFNEPTLDPQDDIFVKYSVKIGDLIIAELKDIPYSVKITVPEYAKIEKILVENPLSRKTFNLLRYGVCATRLLLQGSMIAYANRPMVWFNFGSGPISVELGYSDRESIKRAILIIAASETAAWATGKGLRILRREVKKLM